MKRIGVFLIAIGLIVLGINSVSHKEVKDKKVKAIKKAKKPLTAQDYLVHLKKQYKWMTNSYFKIIYRASNKYNLPVTLTAAVIQAESQGKWWAKGKPVTVKTIRGQWIRTRALGLMQVIPEFHWVGRPKKALRNPWNNIFVGTKYLAYCMKLAKWNVVRGLKNYNAGPGSSYYNWPYINKIIRLHKQPIKKI